MGIAEGINLPLDNLEIAEKTVAETAELEVISELENEENPQQISSPPKAPPRLRASAVTKPILEDATESVVVATDESVIDIKECVDNSSGVEATLDRDSTFITEIEDAEEIMLDNECVEKITQLERTLDESEKEFPVEEAIGGVDESTPEEINEDNIELTETIESEAEDESLVIDVTEPEAKESALTEEVKDTETYIIAKKVVGEFAESDEFPVVEAVDEADEAKPEEILEKKIEANDESLVIDVTDPAATEAALTEEAKDAETDIIAEKAPINTVTTEVDGIEKRPILTLAMIAYVVFMAVFVLFN